MNIVTNTCYISSEVIKLAYYSHLIPIFFSLMLGFLVYFKSPKNILSKIFFSFTIIFSLWLVADLVTWVSNNYNLVYALWAPVDYLETCMYIVGLYFIIVFVNKSEIFRWQKILLFLLALIPFLIKITNNSVLGFTHSVCEGVNNGFLLNYRFFVEILVILLIFIHIFIPFFKKNVLYSRKSHLLITISMLLFLLIFGLTSYLSAVTAYYELNLYALFVIPIFLMVITYAVFTLDIFNLKIISTYFIVFGFIILSASQLIFITSTTNIILSLVSILLSFILSFILLKNLKKESNQRIYIEKLSVELEKSKKRLEETNIHLEDANERLKSLDKLKTEFVSLASHQLRSPLTAIKGYLSMVLEGDYGDIEPKTKGALERVMESSNNLTLVVEDLLNVTKIEQGGMQYKMEKFDFGEEVKKETVDLSITAEKKGLKLICNIPEDQKYQINGDKEKLRQVLINIIDNSMKYTKEGQIEVSLRKNNDKILLSIKDTGAGIAKEIIGTLFQKFSRGDGAKLNSSGSGLGLYLVKEIVEAHKGRAWVESEGLGHGSTFFVELNEEK